jgi:hypothetical protein
VRPDCSVEVLIPDFKGSAEALAIVLLEQPEILNHNVETVPRLFRRVQPQDRYEWALQTLANAKRIDPDVVTKSGLMVGLGETRRNPDGDATRARSMDDPDGWHRSPANSICRSSATGGPRSLPISAKPALKWAFGSSRPAGAQLVPRGPAGRRAVGTPPPDLGSARLTMVATALTARKEPSACDHLSEVRSTRMA